MIYEKIKKLCEECGMSIAALEREAGLANGAIGKWRRVNPTVDNLQAVARVLKVSVDDLLSEES